MREPIFKTIALDPMAREGFTLVDLSAAQSGKTDAYLEALIAAERSKVANPIFSHYFCKEGILQVKGDSAKAGNIEYGLCQALHGEESAVAAFRALCSRPPGGDIILGIHADDKMAIQLAPRPCGNCRDIMRQHLGEYFEIVMGDPEGETAVVVPMRFYLFDEYETVNAAKTSQGAIGAVWETFGVGRRIENDFYSPSNVHPRRKYYASIKTAKHTYFGAHDVMCDYHPIYALRDAIRQARRCEDPFIKEVWIIGERCLGKPPDVMYKDRQHLLELNLQQELMLGEECDPVVFLATYSMQGRQLAFIDGVWKTSVKEWLPFPFTARNFMDLDAMAAYFNRFKK